MSVSSGGWVTVSDMPSWTVLAAALIIPLILLGWWLYDRAWQEGYGYGYSAGLLADDKLDITFELPEEWK